MDEIHEAQEEWIKANRALTQFAAANGGVIAFKTAIADLLRDGRLRSRAKIVWPVEAPNIRTAWKKFSESYDKAAIRNMSATEIVKPVVWRASRRWSADQVDWRWPSNAFSVTRRTSPQRQKVLIKGIEFAKADLIRLFASNESNTSRKGIGGRMNKANWDAFWMEIVDMAVGGRLKPGIFASQAELIEEIAKARSLNEKTIEATVSQVWKKYIESS